VCVCVCVFFFFYCPAPLFCTKTLREVTSEPYFQGRKYNLRACVSILHGSDLRWAIAVAVRRRSSGQGEQKFGRCTLVAVAAPKISL
jgi:hypothetical protein